MKHLGKITVVRDDALRDAMRVEPGFADAKTDLMNGLYNLLQDYIYQKKNEVAI